MPYRRTENVVRRLAARHDAIVKAAGGHAADAGLLPAQDIAVTAPALTGALIEGLIGPLAADTRDVAGTRDAVQTLTLFALRGLGVADARVRGLVVQTKVPERETLG